MRLLFVSNLSINILIENLNVNNIIVYIKGLFLKRILYVECSFVNGTFGNLGKLTVMERSYHDIYNRNIFHKLTLNWIHESLKNGNSKFHFLSCSMHWVMYFCLFDELKYLLYMYLKW